MSRLRTHNRRATLERRLRREANVLGREEERMRRLARVKAAAYPTWRIASIEHSYIVLAAAWARGRVNLIDMRRRHGR